MKKKIYYTVSIKSGTRGILFFLDMNFVKIYVFGIARQSRIIALCIAF